MLIRDDGSWCNEDNCSTKRAFCIKYGLFIQGILLILLLLLVMIDDCSALLRQWRQRRHTQYCGGLRERKNTPLSQNMFFLRCCKITRKLHAENISWMFMQGYISNSYGKATISWMFTDELLTHKYSWNGQFLNKRYPQQWELFWILMDYVRKKLRCRPLVLLLY